MPQPNSGMKAGYKYARSECPVCGKEMADNWIVRHMKKEHPLLMGWDLLPPVDEWRGEL